MFPVPADTRAARIRASLVVLTMSMLAYSGVQHLVPLLHDQIPQVPTTALDVLMPFTGWAIIPYASLAGLLLTAAALVDAKRFRRLLCAALFAQAIAYVFFLCMPMSVPRPHPGTDAGAIDHLAWWLINVSDLPLNTVPSLHVAYALIAATALPRWWCILWAVVVALSVLPLQQHLLLDVVTGALLAGVAWRLTRTSAPEDSPTARRT